MRGKLLLTTMVAMLLGALAFGAHSRKAALPAPHIRLMVQIQPLFNGVPLRFDDVSLINRAGNTLSISRLAYLLSEVTLLRPDGTRVRLDDQVAYLNAAEDRNSFVLTDVPEGHYSGLSFQIGLPPKVNHANPAQYPAGHPLNPLVNGLHWGWQGGYVFLALEGRYVRPDGKLGGYSYHLATDKNPMICTRHQELRLEQNSTLTLRFDVARIFDAVHTIAIRPDGGRESTHTGDNDTLAPQLKANCEQAFAIAGVSASSLSEAGTSATVMTASAPPHTTPYNLALPAHFPQPNLPADNPLTVQGVALGKRLFFDKRLSANNTQSCASCHQPATAFSDRGKALSKGIDGRLGLRNAMPLFNLAWSPTYTWDGQRTRLRDQALAPIQNVREMHQSLQQTVVKLRRDPQYPGLFAHAFGSKGITAERIGLAVEQYLLTLISADSKFDRALKGTAQFTDQEKRGLLLFISEYDPARGRIGADCFHCHGGNLFTDYQFKNNGLDATFRDAGRNIVTGRAADKGKFKTPSLRNVELTGPYMHDGRFRTLEEVIEHYNSGVHRSDTLDPNIAKHPDSGLHLSASDKKALVAFLKTLTEESYRTHTANHGS